MQFDEDTRVSAEPGCVECAFGDGIALLDTRNNSYFTLNAVGQFIWNQIQTPLPVVQVVEKVCDAYAVEPALCDADVRGLLAEMARNRLIHVS